jgi:hypothetical protein
MSERRSVPADAVRMLRLCNIAQAAAHMAQLLTTAHGRHRRASIAARTDDNPDAPKRHRRLVRARRAHLELAAELRVTRAAAAVVAGVAEPFGVRRLAGTRDRYGSAAPHCVIPTENICLASTSAPPRSSDRASKKRGRAQAWKAA